MRILALLATLFVVLPVAELALLLRVGRTLGFWPTLGLVLFTGVLGAALARREGTRTLGALRSEVARGGLPGRAILDGASILVGGALLLTPGFLTDALGFALLFPPTRHVAAQRGKGFQIGLYAGAATRVGSRNGEHAGVAVWGHGRGGAGGFASGFVGRMAGSVVGVVHGGWRLKARCGRLGTGSRRARP
jgi:UPF0716 protein FxsA